MEDKMTKIRLTETFKQRLCSDIYLHIKNGHNTFYKLKEIQNLKWTKFEQEQNDCLNKLWQESLKKIKSFFFSIARSIDWLTFPAKLKGNLFFII